MKKYFILLLFSELLIISCICKIFFTNTYFIPNNENILYTSLQILFHDSLLFFLIFIFTYFSYLEFINYYLSIVLRFISLNIFLLYVADIYILSNFTTHLIIEDIFKYISYVPKYIQQEYTVNLLHILILLTLIFLCSIFLIKKLTIENKSTSIKTFFMILMLTPLPFLAENGRYVHSWFFKSFIEYNYEVYKQSKEYSESLKKTLKNETILSCNNNEKLQKNKNVIILMVESLSSYQSQFFSKIKNWTPKLDEIAKNNIAFKNFYANGFMTEDAEISILTGLFPIYPPKIFSDGGGVSFKGFYNIKDSLPNILNKSNYQTEFITSADLNFSNTGNWAKSIGFKYIEGSEHPFYGDKERYHFKAASDEFLYKRVLNRIEIQKSKYFLFLKTVSSHVPFINPENENLSEEETIRYVDKQIGLFYEKLNELNYFENGILIIVGDHHPLIPLKKEQITLFGEKKAHTLVPMIIVNNETKKTINKNYQQSDIYNSLKNISRQTSCTSNWHGDFFRNISPKYIVHRRGDNRGVISIFAKDIEYEVTLDGDNTQLNNDKINNEVLNKINFERIQREKNIR